MKRRVPEDQRPIRECVHRRRGLEIGIPPGLRSQVDPIFGMLPDPCEVAVEIGSQQGWFAWRLMRYTKIEKLYCVDPWEGELGSVDGDGEYNFQCWSFNLMPYYNRGRCVPIRARSIEAAAAFKEQIDFLFIDGDHTTEGVATDLRVWESKVRGGGLVAGHDWTGFWGKQVQAAVRPYARKEGRRVNHGQIYCYSGNQESSAECWWWTK